MTGPYDRDIDDLKKTTRMLGDRWSLLIVWASLNGVTRFEEIKGRLGIARNILANRLRRLVDIGILERRPTSRGARRMEYSPTRKAEALRPVLLSLRDWQVRAAASSRRSSRRREREEQGVR